MVFQRSLNDNRIIDCLINPKFITMTNNIHSKLSFTSWNVNGINHKILGNKLNNFDFLSNIKNHDFIFLNETWSKEVDSIPGFKAVSTQTAPPRTTSSSRISGGITLLYKTKFNPTVSTEKLTKNFLWSKIDKSALGSSHDLFICGVYIPPENSSYFDNEIFTDLENDIAHYSTKGNIMLLGDFNARTSKNVDYISKEGSSYINDVTENSSLPRNRENFDNIINNHGKKLLELCKHCNLRILNGRKTGDSFGKPTFHGKHGTSVVDYIICDQELAQSIENFIVKPPTYFSDHSQIVTWLKINQITYTSSNDTNTLPSISHKLPMQFIWDHHTSAPLFKESLQSINSQKKIDQLINTNFPKSKDGINEFSYQLQDILLDAAKKSLKMKKQKFRNKINNVSNKKWFDKECRLKRHTVRKLANKKHRDPQNNDLRNEYHKALKIYKDTLKQKKELFHRKQLNELDKASETSPSLFWKTLKNIGDDFDDTMSNTSNITGNNWISHFATLHSKHTLHNEQQNILNKLEELENNKQNNNSLDDPITENEIRNAMKKLKNNKSAYSDRIKNEMIKSSIETLLKAYHKLFNLILECGCFPDLWCEGLITPIFKSGDKQEPSNYRGICVSSAIGKFLCIILNNRLYNFSQQNNLIHPSQIGFLPGQRTADHIFTLKTLLDKHLDQNTNEKVYACFVDFKKAFDSVWHEGLFFKLLYNNIGGNFYNIIKSLYSNSKCAIKHTKSRTPYFPYLKGVRQGCVLSPMLFNIYINELATIFENTSSDPFILPSGSKLSCLLYADDLIILSRSKFGLQNCLNELHNWCQKWMMETNLKKTKIMIFQKGNKKQIKPNFLLGNQTITIVNEYCYLGVKLNQNGKFTLALKQLSEKALHALFSIRRRLNIHFLKPQLAIKIFDSIISPILLYNSEVWGAYLKNDFNNWDKTLVEKTHLRFCKLYLGVGNKTSNVACRGELGHFPMLINIFKNVFKYIIHL